VAPPTVEALAEQLLAMYRAAWERIQAEQASIVDDPMRWRRSARLRELDAQISALMDQVDVQAHDWLRRTFPQIYAAGAVSAAASLPGQFAWTAVHRDAVAHLAQGTFDDLLTATRHVRRTTKAMIREVARAETEAALTTGRTPSQAAAEMRGLLAEKGVWAVTYKDGSRHGLAEYSEVVLRTKTAVAFNAGTLNQSITAGAEFFEVFDGDECGWLSHDDPDQANGKIVSANDAVDVPVSHPNCRRSFGPRPDITTQEEADAAGPTTTEAQRVDQAQFERRRADTLQRTRDRRARLDERQRRLTDRSGLRPPPAAGP
jgi:hypothetical protein